jgi:hypothetical protein
VFRSFAYWAALIFSILFVIASLAIFVALYFSDQWMLLQSGVTWRELSQALTLVLTAIGTFSAVFFGWRLDRRQARELELKIKELELKIGQASSGGSNEN